MRSFRLFPWIASSLIRNTRHTPQRTFTTLRQRPLASSTSALSYLFPKRPPTSPIHCRLIRRLNSSKPSYNPTPDLNSPSLSLSQRLRKLSREYGWSALGVYLLLSALDFPFCFIAVRWLGTDRIGHWEHEVIEWFWRAWPLRIPVPEASGQDGTTQGVEIAGTGAKIEEYGVIEGGRGAESVAVPGYDHGVKDAEQRNKSENASIWTQLALAYAIHKSFIFIRVPLTAAVTPKVVKVLRGWGWDIGKRKPRSGVIAPSKKE
ncbi:hypothetical protein MMC06_006354 [Schaereria dolodes]|nr:hypothetical protein [Schaereria dolodes]